MQAIYSDGELARLLVVSVWLEEERADESDRDAGLRVSPCHPLWLRLTVISWVRACTGLYPPPAWPWRTNGQYLRRKTHPLTDLSPIEKLSMYKYQPYFDSHPHFSRQRFIKPWLLKLPTSAFFFGSHKCSCVSLLPLPSLHSLLLKVWEFFAIYIFSFFIEPTVSVKSFDFCNVEPNLIKIKCNDAWEFTQGCLNSLQIQEQEHCYCLTRLGERFAMIPADELDSFHACCDSNTGGIDRCWIWLVVDTA